MAARRLWLWVPLGLGAALLSAALIMIVALVAFPDLVRAAVVARLRAMTQRPVVIETLTVDPWTGRIALRGLKVTDTDGGTLATLDRLDARVRRAPLLRGHVSLTRLAIEGSTVRVVRYSDGEFNISELIPKKPGGGGPALDVTVDEFTLARGTVLLEDRSLSPWRTWRSEDLAFQARNISTRRDDGTAEASSTINGSPVSARIDQLRLKPVHVRAVVRAQSVDMALARVYLPAASPVTLEKGRLDLTVNVVNDSREGVRPASTRTPPWPTPSPCDASSAIRSSGRRPCAFRCGTSRTRRVAWRSGASRWTAAPVCSRARRASISVASGCAPRPSPGPSRPRRASA
jgi:hypothetical protein